MPKRTRSRTRARASTAARTSESGARSSRATGPRAFGATRAIGAPSPALVKAAQLERGYVMKDFKRIGIVTGIMLVLLVVGGVAVNAILR